MKVFHESYLRCAAALSQVGLAQLWLPRWHHRSNLT